MNLLGRMCILHLEKNILQRAHAKHKLEMLVTREKSHLAFSQTEVLTDKLKQEQDQDPTADTKMKIDQTTADTIPEIQV